MKLKNIAHVFLLAMVITFGISSASLAEEDGGAAWVKAMETHTGLKGLTPLAGCTFTLSKYTQANGDFIAQADISEKALIDFIMQLWNASKSVSTSDIFKIEIRNELNGSKREINDITEFEIGKMDQIGWSYSYDAGAQSKIKGSAKYLLVTINNARSVSFQVGSD